jgi:LytS/YehU family sensor histidine kinase
VFSYPTSTIVIGGLIVGLVVGLAVGLVVPLFSYSSSYIGRPLKLA